MMRNDNSLREDIGYFLRDARKNKSLSGNELGRLMHLSQQQISRYERGTTMMTFDMLQHFLLVLEVSWTDFFFNVIANHSDDIKRMKYFD